MRGLVRERFVRRALGGDVLDHRDEVERVAGGVPGQRHRELGPYRLAGPGQVALVHLVRLGAAGQQVRDVGEVQREVVGVRDRLEGQPGQLAVAVAEQPAERVVALEQDAVQRDDRDADRGVLGGQPEPVLGGLQGRGRAPLGGDVDGGDDGDRRVVQLRRADVEPQPAGVVTGSGSGQPDHRTEDRPTGGQRDRPGVLPGRQRGTVLVEHDGEPAEPADQVGKGGVAAQQGAGGVESGDALVQGGGDMVVREVGEHSGSTRPRLIRRSPREPCTKVAHTCRSGPGGPTLIAAAGP